MLGKDGKALSTNGAPSIGGNWIDVGRAQPAAGRRRHRAAAGPTEVVLDGELAEKAGRQGRRPTTVVPADRAERGQGRRPGSSTRRQGQPRRRRRTSSSPPVRAAAAARRTATPPRSSRPATGSSQDELRDPDRGRPARRHEAITGSQLADEQASDIQEGLGFLNTFLLVFAAVALFVGTFLIFNTFSILVAQRTRELALMRALGAAGRQVIRSVLLEAVVVGVHRVGASGSAPASASAIGLQALFGAFGAGLPVGDLGVPAAHGRSRPSRSASSSPWSPRCCRRGGRPRCRRWRRCGTRRPPDRPLIKRTIAGAVLAVGRRGGRWTFGLTGSGPGGARPRRGARRSSAWRC